jgi:hypothetical protein
LQLAPRYENLTVKKVRQSAVVIHVQVGEDDLFHIARSDAHRAELRTDFVVALDPKHHFPSNIWVKRMRALKEMCSLAGVDDDHALWMVDDPCIRRKPVGPVFVDEYPEPSA